MRNFEEERRRLVERLRAQGVGSEEVLAALGRVKRHFFVPQHLAEQAYADYPLPIGEGQTISAPHIVALMCTYLELRRGEKVLEIGAGSGYHAAVVAELVGEEGQVYSVERVEWLAEFARANLRRAGYTQASEGVVRGDGTLGLPEHAPYDKISVACAAPDVPPPLLEQLRAGGRMVIPIGKFMQTLYLVKKEKGKEKERERQEGREEVVRERKCSVVFVPLVGRYGFREED
ncbi:MAG: protein-L-isoaspartate O-methyltransferase [Candidatus Methanophagaceae archaeon]|nr:MAG: protein-L-isoaspartate O-methyltransferase [Methanophagales archaeon]